jgi:Subtilase family
MSFGLPSYDHQIAQMIGHAKAKNITMFAAASNGGMNLPRTYPATDVGVIAVHAMSGNGAEGDINPTTEKEHDSFGTLGLGIELWWRNKSTRGNGTSYATPIAAGMAANWLEWLNYVGREASYDVTRDQHLTWGSTFGIRRIFANVMCRKERRLLYVAPWFLWVHGATDKDVIGRLKCTDTML